MLHSSSTLIWELHFGNNINTVYVFINSWPDTDKGNDECNDVAEHVEAIRHKRHGAGHVAD